MRRSGKTEAILSYLLTHPNSSIPEISEALGFSDAHVGVVLKNMAVKGIVERRTTLSKKTCHPWVNEWRIVDGSQ